mmetsp:Transcript_7039/g.8018  ORF Transcript_7039/g.8018 Transcript_7039/m.8018 type:complete len:350 (+) Transcript_7039:224-1273(+)
MVQYTLWGTEVDLDLPKEIFPTDDEMKKLEDNARNSKHDFFRSSRGDESYLLHYRTWLPKEGVEPKGICIYQHGIQANSGMACKLKDGTVTKTAVLTKNLVEAGYEVYGLDMLGHGFSEGRRFYIPDGDWTINRDDLASFAMHISRQKKELPLFLFGESYGSCLAIHVARQWMDDTDNAPANFKGICVIAPAIIGDLPPTVIVKLLTYLASKYPTKTPFFMPATVSPERIWRVDEVREYFTAPREHEMRLHGGGNKFCLGTALGLLNALEESRTKAIPGLTVPFAVAHGTNDYGVPIAGTHFLLDHSVTPEEDREVRILEGAFHDLLSEESSDETMEFFIKWMSSRIAK